MIPDGLQALESPAAINSIARALYVELRCYGTETGQEAHLAAVFGPLSLPAYEKVAEKYRRAASTSIRAIRALITKDKRP